jgi:lysophospholipase L1-like esterase
VNKMILSVALLCLSVLPSFAGEAPAAETTLHRERIEWCDIWFTDAEKSALPRVLLIGDSITRGYFDGVEKDLKEQAYLARLTTSRSVCDPVFFEEVSLVVRQYPFAVIHFNNGLHGWDYTEEEYRAGMEKFIAELRALAPGAKLICALTTPVQDHGGMKDHAARVAQRNTIARELCSAAGIAVNDLHAVVAGYDKLFSSDGVHFNDDGRKFLADAVSQAVKEMMP